VGGLVLGIGLGIGFPAAAAAAASDTPLTILGSALLQYSRADVGTAASWTDQTGNGRHYVQGTGSAQPTLNATGGPNSTPCFDLDGTDDFWQITGFALPDPTTTPTLVFFVLKQNSWTGGDRIFGDSAGFRHVLYTTGASPQMRITATVDGPVNGAAAIGAWVFGLAYFSDSTSDYLQLKATKVTGTNVASAAGTNRQLGCSGSASFGHFSIAEIGHVNRDLTGGELTQMQTYITARYGSGLTS